MAGELEKNKYILANHSHFDLPLVCRPTWKWNLYTKQSLFYLFITLILMMLLVFTLYTFYKYMAQIAKQKRVGTRLKLKSQR